jgi:hypothetical protein
MHAMTSHPYYTVLTVATGLVTVSLLFFIILLCGWATTKWGAARDQRAWARSTRTDWDAEAEQLCADTERP